MIEAGARHRAQGASERAKGEGNKPMAKGEGRRAKGKVVCFLVALVLLVVCAPVAFAAPKPPPRPLAGKGIVAIPADSGPVLLYESPGVRRLAELPVKSLPAVVVSAEELVVPVIAEKGEWLRVVYDDAGREGWIAKPRSWQVYTWTEAFKRRFVRLYGGMKASAYILRKKPAESGEQVATVAARKPFRILAIHDQWGKALVDFTHVGWVKWKDEDGRLLVTVE